MMRRLSNRWLWCAVSLFALIVPTAGRAENVLLLIADDVHVVNIGAYNTGANSEGGAPPPTPNIDALAAQGVLFRNAWSSPVCSPTRAGILTGRYSFRTGIGEAIMTGSNVLSLTETTLMEVLATGGRPSACLGKWHLGTAGNGGQMAPNRAGWNHYAGGLMGALTSYTNWARTVNGTQSNCTVYATTQQVDDAVAWIGAQTTPWFCTVAFNAAHSPFHAPPAALHTRNLIGLDPNTTPIPFYKASIEAMDSEIGRLLTAISGELAETTIVFVGDNGTPSEVVEAPYQGMRVKNTVYEGGVNVPLIVRGPGVASPGRECAAIVSTVDLFATIAELFDINARAVVPASVPLDSVSMVPYLANASQAALRRTVFTERFDGNAFEAGVSAMRGTRYKLIRTNGVERFHDLLLDPLETDNLLPTAMLTADEYRHYIGLACEISHLRGDATTHNCNGDANCDGLVNASDVSAFVSALLDPATYAAEYGYCAALNADVNHDGERDGDDVPAFVAAIVQ